LRRTSHTRPHTENSWIFSMLKHLVLFWLSCTLLYCLVHVLYLIAL
jgi:hypothetical protein